MTFASREELAQFTLAVTSAATGPLGVAKAASATPPIVFESPAVTSGIGAYVSVGAAQLLRLQGSPFAISPEPIDLADLPEGFSLLVGDQSDYYAYLNRRSK